MKRLLVLAVAASFGLSGLCAITWRALAGSDLVAFPSNYAEGVHYATVHRGNIREELFTSRAAIKAAKNGQPLPSGTIITMEDHRDGTLFRYVVMEKRAGWGVEYPPEKRIGEWEFQAFNADRSVKHSETIERCFACHKSQASQDFVFTIA